MPTNSPRIQISAKVPPYLKEFLVKLDPLDNSNAVNLALEIAFKEYNKTSGENIENNAVSRNYSDYTIAEINGFATEIEKLKAENAKLKAVFETENKTDFEKATTEAFVKGYNMHESERKEAHQKGYDLGKAELHQPKTTILSLEDNIIQIHLESLESAEIARFLKDYGFEEDRYLTPENEARAKAEFDKILETELNAKNVEIAELYEKNKKAFDYQTKETLSLRQKIDKLESNLEQTDSGESLQKLMHFVSDTKALLTEFESYSASIKKRLMYEYDFEYLVKKYFSIEFHAILLAK